MAIGSPESASRRISAAHTRGRTANGRKSASVAPPPFPKESPRRSFAIGTPRFPPALKGCDQARGEGEASLTPRQAHALAGAWYSWFIAQYEEDPGTADEWGIVADEYEDVCLKFRPRDEHTGLLQEDEPRNALSGTPSIACLHGSGRLIASSRTRIGCSATPQCTHSWTCLKASFLRPSASCLAARKGTGPAIVGPRSSRNLLPSHADKPAKLSGLTVWSAFELWIDGRKPAAASINRWRAVFVGLREQFADRDVATIAPDEAQEWTDSLTTSERSAHVVHEVWLRAANVVFGWAVARKRLQTNPFRNVSVALPKRPPKLREREFNEDEWRTMLKATLEPSPPRMEPHNADRSGDGSRGFAPTPEQGRERRANSGPKTFGSTGTAASGMPGSPLRRER